MLATVFFTDLVRSTEQAVEVGDRRWAGLVGAHHGVVRRELEPFGGRELDVAGDGFFFSGAVHDLVAGSGLSFVDRG